MRLCGDRRSPLTCSVNLHHARIIFTHSNHFMRVRGDRRSPRTCSLKCHREKINSGSNFYFLCVCGDWQSARMFSLQFHLAKINFAWWNLTEHVRGDCRSPQRRIKWILHPKLFFCVVTFDYACLFFILSQCEYVGIVDPHIYVVLYFVVLCKYYVGIDDPHVFNNVFYTWFVALHE